MKAAGQISGLAIIAFVACGCGQENKTLWQHLTQLRSEKTQLAVENQRLADENSRLNEQVQTLAAIDPNIRLAELATLEKITLGKRTGFYDRDGDGKVENLTVYLEPIDQAQDRIKAIGSLRVQLWDLNAPKGQDAMPAQWTLTPQQLQRLWSSAFLTNYYHVPLPLPQQLIGAKGEFTVKVEFTDCFSGKTCRDQRVITGR